MVGTQSVRWVACIHRFQINSGIALQGQANVTHQKACCCQHRLMSRQTHCFPRLIWLFPLARYQGGCPAFHTIVCHFVLFSWFFSCFFPIITIVDASACFPRPSHSSKHPSSLCCSQYMQGRASTWEGWGQPVADGNVYQTQMLFDKIGLQHQQVKSSFLASLLPNSLVKQYRPPPRVLAHPLCALTGSCGSHQCAASISWVYDTYC